MRRTSGSTPLFNTLLRNRRRALSAGSESATVTCAARRREHSHCVGPKPRARGARCAEPTHGARRRADPAPVVSQVGTAPGRLRSARWRCLTRRAATQPGEHAHFDIVAALVHKAAEQRKETHRAGPDGGHERASALGT